MKVWLRLVLLLLVAAASPAWADVDLDGVADGIDNCVHV